MIDARQLGEHTHALSLSDQRQVVVRLGDVAAEEAALRKLASEIDLPVPELLGSNHDGSVAGQPWLLRSYLAGTPLPDVIATLDEGARYALGRRLGEIMARVHTLACERYGVLVGKDPYATTRDDLAYTSLRAEAAIARVDQLVALPQPGAPNTDPEPLLPTQLVADLRAWFAQQYDATGRKAALVHGDLRPEHILVRQARQTANARFQISGVLSWKHALGWAPGWDHVCLLETASDSAYFGLRVGYGESYDEVTQRMAEQVREYALLPYRLILELEALAAAEEWAVQGRHVRVLAALLRSSTKAREERDD